MQNVWKFGGYSRRYYLTHPWKWFGDFFRRCRWAWQRSKRGYADCDWWDMDRWMIAVLPPMLEDFASHHYGYPGEEAGFTDETWTAYLREIAQHLRNCDEEQTTNINEYAQEYEKMVDAKSALSEVYEDDKGRIHHVWPEDTPEQEELSKKYTGRCLDIYQWQCEEAVKAFEMLGKQFFSMWD